MILPVGIKYSPRDLLFNQSVKLTIL